MGKSKVVTTGRPQPLLGSFAAYDEAKAKFSADPASVYAASGGYIATCRDLENRFAIYKLSDLGEAEENIVAFHKVILGVNERDNRTL